MWQKIFYFFIGLTENKIFFPPLVGGWEEKWELKLTSAKVVVEVEAELGNNKIKSKLKTREAKSLYWKNSEIVS